MNCLLCQSDNIIQIAKIDVNQIIKKYRKYFHVDFKYLFKVDDINLLKCTNCDLRFFYPMVAGDEYFYSELQKSDNYYRENKEEYIFAAQIIKKDNSILDVGCGTGAFKNFVPECNFTGLEMSSEAIRAGIKNGCNILNESIQEHAKSDNNRYDFVTVFQVLEHVTNVDSFIKSCAQCVKPGGHLIISVPSEESYLQFSVNSILNMPPHHISRWTNKALSHIAEVINFQLIHLYHDSMDALHTKSYFTTLIEKSLPIRFSNETKLIDDSIYFKIRYYIASMFADRILKNCNHSAWLGKGQNITLVLKKSF